MKKINAFLIFLVLTFSSLTFATPQPTWASYGTKVTDSQCSNIAITSNVCSAGEIKRTLNPQSNSGVKPGSGGTQTCTFTTATVQCAANPCTNGQTWQLVPALGQGMGACGPPSCPAGQTLNTVINGADATISCVTEGSNTGSASSASSSTPACPSGQFRDGNNQCNTKCQAPNTYNPINGNCEAVKQCVYPELYSSIFNSCTSNPNKCSIGSRWDIISQSCVAYTDTSCPAGFTPTNNGLNCEPNASGSSSPSNNASSTPSNNASSAPSNNSSAANGSTGSNSSVSPTKPPISASDNTSPSQSTTNSNSIPAGINSITCNQLFSASSCKAIQDCQLTFGVDKCIGMTSTQNCPNSYVINGQKICVMQSVSNGSASSASGSGGSGSNTSTGKGECDPTAKDYDECLGRNKTPSVAETKAITDSFETANNKLLADFEKTNNDAIDDLKNNSVPFKTATDSLKSTLLSFFPQYQQCQSYTMTFKIIGTVTLSCQLFDMWKRLFGWFLSASTAIYIYHLSIRPIQR